MTELEGLHTAFLLNKVDKVERLPAWVNYIAKEWTTMKFGIMVSR
jgi:hypothetical protein